VSQKDLISKINEASNIISKKNRTGSGNYIVTSPTVANALKEMYDNYEKYEKRKRIIEKLLKGNS
jgi:hypothetical protein